MDSYFIATVSMLLKSSSFALLFMRGLVTKKEQGLNLMWIREEKL